MKSSTDRCGSNERQATHSADEYTRNIATYISRLGLVIAVPCRVQSLWPVLNSILVLHLCCMSMLINLRKL